MWAEYPAHGWSAGNLFGEKKFATSIVALRFGQEEYDLQREGNIAVDVLVEAVEVSGLVQQQGCGTLLTALMTDRGEFCECEWEVVRVEQAGP